MTALVKAEDFFTINAADIAYAYEAPTVEARAVAKGELTVNGIFQIRAPEAGWEVRLPGGSRFFAAAEFAQYFVPVALKGDVAIPEGTKIEPVKKGETIVTQPWSDTTLGVQSKADCDGFIVILPEEGKRRFFSEASFRATFAHDLPEKPVEGQGMFRYLPQPDDEAVPYITLKAGTVFDFKDGPCEAAPGDVLYKNADDKDGYTLGRPDYFAQNFIVAKP